MVASKQASRTAIHTVHVEQNLLIFAFEAAFLDSSPGMYRRAIFQQPKKFNAAVRLVTIPSCDRHDNFIDTTHRLSLHIYIHVGVLEIHKTTYLCYKLAFLCVVVVNIYVLVLHCSVVVVNFYYPACIVMRTHV